MVNEDFISDVDRFVILDVLNSLSGTEDVRNCLRVQIVNSSNEFSYQDKEEIKNRVGIGLKLKEKRDRLFTITINVEAENNNQLFR